MSDPSEPAPLRRREWPFWLLFWVAIACVTIIAVDYTKTFSDCMHEHKNNKDYQQIHKNVGVFAPRYNEWELAPVLSMLVLANFTVKNNGSIVAFATVMVGLFTFTLWRSTNGLWLASRRHADHAERAIMVAEASAARQLRAYVFVTKLR